MTFSWWRVSWDHLDCAESQFLLSLVQSLANNSASSQLNRSDHFWSISSNLWLVQTATGRLVEYEDLDLTNFFFSSTFFFFSASCALEPVSWPSTAFITDTSARSTRVGLRVTEDEDDGFLDGVVSDLSHVSFFNL